MVKICLNKISNPFDIMGNKARFAAIVTVVVINIFTGACLNLDDTSKRPPEAVAGIMDLSDWDFERDGSVNLVGEWAFFWEDFHSPDLIASFDRTNFVPVPNSWTNYDIEGEEFPPEGFGTYTLKLILPDEQLTFGLHNEGQGSAYSMWVDGSLIAQR